MFNRKKRRIKELEDIVSDLNKKVEDQDQYRKELTSLFAESDVSLKRCENKLTVANRSLDTTIEKLKKIESDKKSLSCRIGGMTKEINKLRQEVSTINSEKKDLEIKLKESMTGKYVVKKVAPGRTPNLNKTKIGPPMSTRVTKFMKENYDD